MKLGIVVASENALPSAFAVFRGIEKSAEIINRLGDAEYHMRWDFTEEAISNGTWFLSIYWD